MSSLPLLTIMIPTYNQGASLPQSVASALAQDYGNLEVVIADDCSPDNTGVVIQPFLADPRVRYFRNETNLGRVGNYKRALGTHARGEWVINLDGDDYYSDPGFLSRAMDLIAAAPAGPEGEIVFLQAGHVVRDAAGKAIREDVPEIPSASQVVTGAQYFLEFHHFSHLATVYRRKPALALDFYRYDILSSDIESFLRLALQGRVILVKAVVGVWVHHGANESKRLDIPTVEKNMLRIEGPYVYAKGLGVFSDAELLQWRNAMTRAYIRSYLILSLRTKGLLDGYLRHVARYYPQLWLGTTIPAAFMHALIWKISRYFAKDR